MPVQTAIQVRRGTASSWTSTNPTLAAGEIGFETDTSKFKIGTGSTAWNSLNYFVQDPVTTKGDLYTFSTTDTRLAVGNNGETLVADTSTSTGLRYNPQNALVNPVINGGMDIWQRGTSLTPSAGVVTYTTDRWQTYRGVSGYTVSRQTTSDTTNLANIQYSARLQRTAGNTATDTIYFTQSIETANTIPYAGKTLTLTFYARAGANYSAASSQFFTVVYSGTGTDQNVNNGYTGSAQLVLQSNTLTTTWQRFAHTFTLGATATEFAPYFYWTPTGTAGANDWVEITGVQFDIGTYTASSAPTFRRAGGTLAGELAACQRYYWRTTGQSATANDLMTGWANSTTSAVGVLRFPVTMRGAATGNFGAAGDFGFTWSAGTSTITGANIDRISAESLNLRLTTTGLTTGQGGAIFLNSGTTKWIEASAEL